MQSVCIKEAGVNASGPLEDETTLIGLTFGGYLRSKVTPWKQILSKILTAVQVFVPCPDFKL